jgi:hypothetical protein
MDSLAPLRRHLARDGGTPTAKDFDAAGMFLGHDGDTVVDLKNHRSYTAGSGLAEYAIVGHAFIDGKSRTGRFLLYRGPNVITERVVHVYSLNPMQEPATAS